MASYVDSTLLQGETVLYRARVSLWSLAHLIVLGVLLFVVLVGIGILVWVFIRYTTTEFAVTDKRLIVKTGLVSRKTTELFLDKVESLQVEQSVTGRLLDFGSVTIHGTGTMAEPIENISAPLMLRKQFMQAADLYRQKVK